MDSLPFRAAEDVFDHSSHYEYLMEAAWEAVEQIHKSESYETDISSQMVSKYQTRESKSEGWDRGILQGKNHVHNILL